LKLTLIAVGHKMPVWVAAAFEDYSKRFPPDWPFTLKELKPEVGDNAAQTKAREAEKIRAALPKNATVVILDERGKDLTTQALAAQLEHWQGETRHLAFVIGGADGLDDGIKQAARFTLRLSSLTLPHMLVRVLLAEQLYRAWSILNNHPYHRA
jgi:23S rRNA (pseudouridine1915-N3)-methyltransferase